MHESARERSYLNGASPADTPFLVLDPNQAQENLESVRTAFAGLRPQVFYSMKANSEPELLKALSAMGCGFDVASAWEIGLLDRLGIPLDKVIFSSTVKVPAHISLAYERGIRRFAFDSHTEVDKLAQYAPGSQAVLRLEVPHRGSRWPLAGKFGVPANEAVQLLCYARNAGLEPYGFTFHVGSQCIRKESWVDAIQVCERVWRDAEQAGIQPRFLNLGGGLPTRYVEDVPSVEEIGEHATRKLRATFGDDIEYAIEPGRFIAGSAGSIVMSVIGKAMRKGQPWVFVDLSIYAGLLEVTGGWSYPMLTWNDHLPKRTTTLAGPTCDSTDIIAADVQLPDLDVGDRIVLLQAGAYTTSYRQYNGFSFPTVLTARGDSDRMGIRVAA